MKTVLGVRLLELGPVETDLRVRRCLVSAILSGEERQVELWCHEGAWKLAEGETIDEIGEDVLSTVMGHDGLGPCIKLTEAGSRLRIGGYRQEGRKLDGYIRPDGCKTVFEVSHHRGNYRFPDGINADRQIIIRDVLDGLFAAFNGPLPLELVHHKVSEAV